MLRFIMTLLGKTYEPCKSCAILQYQLDMVNHEKEMLMNTLLDLVKPKVIEHPVTHVEPIKSKIISWNRERAILEENARNEAKIRAEIKRTESELGVENASKVRETIEVYADDGTQSGKG